MKVAEPTGLPLTNKTSVTCTRKHKFVRLNARQAAAAGARPGTTVVTRTDMLALGAPDAKAWAGQKKPTTADRRTAAAAATPEILARREVRR